MVGTPQGQPKDPASQAGIQKWRWYCVDSRASDTFRATAYRGVSGCVRSGAWSVGLAALAVSAWPPKFKIRKNTLSL